MLAYLFVVLAIVVRFLPHPLSFTPVAAALLFFGAKMPRKQAWIPIALLAASDVILTKVVYAYPLTVDHFVTWAWYGAAIAIGSLLAKNDGLVRVVTTAIASSLSFFVVSNFAVWMVWNMYPKTLDGLAACYIAAIPFYRNNLIADPLFAVVMFSVPMAIELFNRKHAKQNIEI